MRHNKKGSHLGRTTSHRKALLRNLVISLIEHKAIKTTHAKAMESRRFAERVLTYAKKGSVHHRRLAFKLLQNKEAVKILFDEIAPAIAERNGGYTRITKLGLRAGDAASISRLELVDFSGVTTKEKPAQSSKKSRKAKEQEPAPAEAEKAESKKEE